MFGGSSSESQCETKKDSRIQNLKQSQVESNKIDGRHAVLVHRHDVCARRKCPRRPDQLLETRS